MWLWVVFNLLEKLVKNDTDSFQAFENRFEDFEWSTRCWIYSWVVFFRIWRSILFRNKIRYEMFERLRNLRKFRFSNEKIYQNYRQPLSLAWCWLQALGTADTVNACQISSFLWLQGNDTNRTKSVVSSNNFNLTFQQDYFLFQFEFKEDKNIWKLKRWLKKIQTKIIW